VLLIGFLLRHDDVRLPQTFVFSATTA